MAAELALREKIGGLVLQSTFTSITDIGAELFPWLPVRLISAIKYNTRAKLPRLRVPVLILHSREDDLIPFHHADENFAAAREPKHLQELQGGHNDTLFASRPAMLEAVRRFLQYPQSGATKGYPGLTGGRSEPRLPGLPAGPESGAPG